MQVWNTLQGGQRRGREEWRNHLSLTCLGLHAQLIRINHVSGREGGKVEKDPEYSGAQPPCHLSLHLFEYHILCICVCTCVYVCVSVCVGVIFICSQFLCICAKSLHLGPTLCDPVNYSLQGSSVHGDSPGKNTEVGCHAFLQGNFPDPRIEPSTLTSPALAGGFFTTSAIREAPISSSYFQIIGQNPYLVCHYHKALSYPAAYEMQVLTRIMFRLNFIQK